MLAVIATHITQPAEESVDRDPGILTLAALVTRSLRRSVGTAFARRCDQARRTTFLAQH
ncbi:hypothetical protein [Methylobacterium sp. A54F]